MQQSLLTKYRPTDFKEVIGQDRIVKSIKALFDVDQVPNAFLFVGPSGVGKTTVARIVASKLEATEVIEIDSASYNGVEFMREFIGKIKLPPFDGGNRIVIMDECHTLTSQSWETLLKITEDAPEFLYFVFCTTDPSKVPNTVKTRCLVFSFIVIDSEEIFSLLEDIADEEDIDVPDGALELISEECNGSVRNAISMLQLIIGCDTIEEVKAVIGSTVDNTSVIDLCRTLVKSSSFKQVIPHLRNIKPLNHEGVRIQIANYLTSCVLNSKSEDDTLRFLNLLSKFKDSVNYSTSFSSIVLKVAECYYE